MEKPKGIKPEPSHGGMPRNIVIVQHQPSSRKLIQKLLTQVMPSANISVLQAQDVAKIIIAKSPGSVTHVITNIGAERDGMEFIQNIRSHEIRTGTRVSIMAASANQTLEKEAIDAGADHFFHFGGENIAPRLKEALKKFLGD